MVNLNEVRTYLTIGGFEVEAASHAIEAMNFHGVFAEFLIPFTSNRYIHFLPTFRLSLGRKDLIKWCSFLNAKYKLLKFSIWMAFPFFVHLKKA